MQGSNLIMYPDQTTIISISSKMFKKFKPLYIIYTVFGLSSFKIHGNKITGTGKVQKFICILACVTLTWADVSTYRSLFKNQYDNDKLKITLDFFCYLSFLMCVLISWIMAAFVNGECAIKMIQNYCEVDRHLKVFTNLKSSQPLYLKILFIHILTFTLVFTYAIIGYTILYGSFERVWPFIFMLIGSVMVLKFVTEISMIKMFIDNIIRKIDAYENADKPTGTGNELNTIAVSIKLNKMMDLYIRLYENSCIANDVASLPVNPRIIYVF